MTIYADHLAAIIAAPEDDIPRLALAHHLAEQVPDLSQLIQLQVGRVNRQRARGWHDTTRMTTAERRLIRRSGTMWWRGIARYIEPTWRGTPAWTFFRGFVAQVRIEPEMFIEFGGELLAESPIRHVDFTPVSGDDLERLLEAPELERLDSVAFASCGLDDRDVIAIAACSRLSHCLHLDLRGNSVGAPGFEALAGSPHLRQLIVVEHSQGSAALRELAARPAWVNHMHHVSRFDARWYANAQRNFGEQCA